MAHKTDKARFCAWLSGKCSICSLFARKWTRLLITTSPAPPLPSEQGTNQNSFLAWAPAAPKHGEFSLINPGICCSLAFSIFVVRLLFPHSLFAHFFCIRCSLTVSVFVVRSLPPPCGRKRAACRSDPAARKGQGQEGQVSEQRISGFLREDSPCWGGAEAHARSERERERESKAELLEDVASACKAHAKKMRLQDRSALQGYLAHQKQRPPRTLQ